MKLGFLSDTEEEINMYVPKDVNWVRVNCNADKSFDPNELKKLADVDALVSGAVPVNDTVLDAAPNVKLVHTLGVGYDQVDVPACTRRNIPVCNNAGYNKEAVAEYNMMHILLHAKRFLDGHTLTHAGGWEGRRPISRASMELPGKTLGIVGFGNTGKHLAKRAKGFDLNIIYNDVKEVDADFVKLTDAKFVEKADLFKTADIVCICTDLNDTSRGLVTAELINSMKQGALFICCARGKIVDETAVRKAVDSGHLSGAGFDVFYNEPITPDSPLIGAANISMTPHLAGVNPSTSERAYTWALENILRLVVRDERPERIVNGL